MRLQQPNLCVTSWPRGAALRLPGGLFWYHRGSRLLPTSAAERELWTIWIGYFTTYFVIVIIILSLTHFGIYQPNPDWPDRDYFRELLPYPFISMVSGLAFFIMGANYWGRCYAIGAAFFVGGGADADGDDVRPVDLRHLVGDHAPDAGAAPAPQAAKAAPPPINGSASSPPSQMATVQYKAPK